MADRFETHMSDADALMWNIERDPQLRSTIVAVIVLDSIPDWSALQDRIEQASWAIPRMRQRVVTPMLRLGPPHWSAAPDFDLRYHVRRLRVPSPGDFAAVLDLARTAAMSPFDRARPLWEYTAVDGLADGTSAMILKVHHSMTDGVGGLELLMGLFDLERVPDPGDDSPDSRTEPEDLDALTPLGLVGPSIDHRRRRTMGIAHRGVGEGLRAAQRLALDPTGTATEAARAGKSVAEYLAPATSPRSPIMQGRTLGRDLATLEFPLDRLKAAGRSVGGSLNDAFVAGAVGGLARYHEFHGAPLDDLRMMMPINLRVEGDALGGNHFTPARFLVPADVKDPAERISVLSERCRWIRDEPAVNLTDTLATVFNALPIALTTTLLGTMFKCADFVTSNMAGAPVPVYLAGARLDRIFAFAPLSGAAVNFALISYCGLCCIGVNSDSLAVPDPETLLEHVDAAFAEVLALAP
ncbi:MAG: wax ester/triacylglycerol synthase family O-acyltransferase [Acidimicrobiia bacterium]